MMASKYLLLTEECYELARTDASCQVLKDFLVTWELTKENTRIIKAALIGTFHTLPVSQILEIFGEENCKERIRDAILWNTKEFVRCMDSMDIIHPTVLEIEYARD